MHKFAGYLTTLAYAGMMIFAVSCAKEKNELVHDHAHEHALDDDDDHHGHNHEGHEGHNHGSGDEIHLEPEQASRMGVETAEVKSVPFASTLLVTATISAKESAMGTVSATTPGIFSFAAGISIGSQVKKGQQIGSIKATDIGGGDINEAARVNLANAKRELDRLTPLYEKQLVTADKYNAALAAYELAKVQYSPVAATGVVTSPVSGIVTELLVGQGQYVSPGTEIAKVSDSSTLLLTADVPDRYASLIPSFGDARIVSANGGISVDLSQIGGHKIATSSTRTALPGYIPVVFEFRNDGSFVPGSVVEAYLIGPSRSNALTVPVDAVTEQQGSYFVYVKVDDDGYLKSPVTLGARDGRSIEILSGLHPGDVVVTAGVSALRLAETSGAVPEGHTHSH